MVWKSFCLLKFQVINFDLKNKGMVNMKPWPNYWTNMLK